MTTKGRVTLTRGAVPLARFMVITLLCLAVVAFSMWLIAMTITGELGGFQAVMGVAGLAAGGFGAWVCAVGALRGASVIPLATWRNTAGGTSWSGLTALGTSQRTVVVAPEDSIEVSVSIFLEEALSYLPLDGLRGKREPTLVRVLLIEAGLGDQRFAHVRGMATTVASDIDWVAWGTREFGVSNRVTVHVDDTTLEGVAPE